MISEESLTGIASLMGVQEKQNSVWAIVPAAGNGERFSQNRDKLLTSLGGVSVLMRTVSALLSSPVVDGVVVVSQPEKTGPYRQVLEAVSLRDGQRLLFAEGGASRQASVYNGLQALPASVRVVLVHDAARPFVRPEWIEQGVSRICQGELAVMTGLAIHDTVKRSLDGKTIASTVDRNQLWRAQTPQFFDAPSLLSAYLQADALAACTDDAQLFEMAGFGPIGILPGDERNLKVTLQSDLVLAECLFGIGFSS